MRTLSTAAALFLALLCFVPCVDAASRMDVAVSKADAAASKPAAESADSNPAMAAAPSAVVLSDPGTRQKYLAAMQRYYEYRADGYAYRSRVFEWQLFSSRVIFGIVLMLVCAGIYFAAVQFRAAMLAARRELSAPPSDGATATRSSPLDTKLEISATGLVVNSSVLGVIILALSLGFFYLYLVYVYPIQNVF
jgi:hypothetical protein